MTISDQDLIELLVRENYATKADLSKAEEGAAAASVPLGTYLVREGLLSKELLGQAYAEKFGVSYANFDANPPTKERVLALPELMAREYRVVLYKQAAEQAIVATDDPSRAELVEPLAAALNQQVVLAYAFPEDIDTALRGYAKPLETRFSKIMQSSERVAPEILDEIFTDAVTLSASDIHFEPHAGEVEVRFRIDGVLHEAGRIPRELYDNILNRLKVLAHERIDEHQTAQDGALRFEKDGQIVDMRSSIIPTVDGEKVALRVLSSYFQGLALGDLGLSAEQEKAIRLAGEKPFGMILVTGPTGSGKTTTLYTLIKLLNTPEVNITTIEDPVEYKMQGVNQIQVNPDTRLTFAEGLRSIVRQDPDIILVGEIRDNETAEIAVNAALTGHLLLSTFHANDAATAIPRLLDMNIEPFLLSSTLVVVVAERLVRTICKECRVSAPIQDPQWREHLDRAGAYLKGVKTLYLGKGCSVCNNTGFKGRTGIFEFIEVDSEMKDLIVKHPSAQEVWRLARSHGALSLFEDGIEKVKAGITTLDELMRVAEPPVEENRM